MIQVLSKITAKLISGIVSAIQHKTMREKYYELLDEHEIMWTALDDIATRIGKDHPSGVHARTIQKLINEKYGPKKNLENRNPVQGLEK
jgi:hypothetical protein